ncbi:hypothetical protein [Alienimonas chondri]|uniref:Uncharacterized protein n=1 Tax=Alienimonas chondri TaxID=2681879 RepID=A0ABX1VG14_9PLAN|nr:hypothetical protein [Alienimonas chondri]NNJ26820.1 hypothetical protein [Alienimonas chondri]
MSRFVAAALITGWGLCRIASSADGDVLGEKSLGDGGVSVGVGGFVRPGAWVPIGPLANDPSANEDTPDATAVVAVTDGDGLTLARPVDFPNGRAALVQAGRAESSIDVRLDRIPTVRWTANPGEDFTVLAPDERLWAAVRMPAAMKREETSSAGPLDRPGRPVRVAAFESADELPTIPHALATVRALLIDANDLPADDGFLREYVADGGHLIVSLSVTGELPDWLPLTPGDPTPLTARATLERLAKSGSGRGTTAVINKLLPAAVRPLDAAEVSAANGRVLASGDGGALVAELPIGFGRATIVAASLHEPPLSNWGGLPSFLLELTRSAPGGGPGDRPPIGEMAGQVYGALEAEAVGGASPGTVGAWALVLLLVVGPLDYLLVHRLLNRPALTWVTLPIWLGGAVALALWGAGGDDATVRRLEVVDVDATSGRVRGAAWASVPAPEAGRLSLAFQPAESVRVQNGDERIAYAAEPGATFGGLYRGGGVGLVPAEYRIAGAQALGVPLPERSAKRFRLDWSGKTDELATGSLVAVDGTLRGSVSHSLPGTLSDFFLVHKGRVYRPDPKAEAGPAAETLPPGTAFRPDGAGVVRRDLRGFLTQVREVREGPTVLSGNPNDPNAPLKFDETQRLVFTRYAAKSRDFGVILPALSLYAQSGGAAFTRLSNAELESLDLSATAASGRALLFGRLDTSLTDLDVTFGEEAPADGATETYVRLILPVAEGEPNASPPSPATGPIRLDPNAESPTLPRRRPLDGADFD